MTTTAPPTTAPPTTAPPSSSSKVVVLVTGGRGLLGHGLKSAAEGLKSQMLGQNSTQLYSSTTGTDNNTAGTDNNTAGTDNNTAGTDNNTAGTVNNTTGTDSATTPCPKWLTDWIASNLSVEERLQWLGAEYYWASTKDGDLRDYSATEALFQRVQPTHVVHLAARVGGLFANMAGNIEFMRDNLQLNDNVLRLCHEHQVGRAIFCLSTCVFPPDAPLPIKETSLHQGPPHFSNEGYAMAKRVLECMTRFYCDTYGYSWVCVCPTNLYGHHDNYNLDGGHVLPAMLHRCLLAKRAQKPFVVMGTGKPLRQFLYNEDAGRILLAFLTAPRARITAPVYSLCPDADQEVSILNLAKYVAAEFDYVEHMIWDTTKADGVYRKTACNEQLRTFLNVTTLDFVPLDTGVQLTAAWFKKAFENGDARL